MAKDEETVQRPVEVEKKSFNNVSSVKPPAPSPTTPTGGDQGKTK